MKILKYISKERKESIQQIALEKISIGTRLLKIRKPYS